MIADGGKHQKISENTGKQRVTMGQVSTTGQQRALGEDTMSAVLIVAHDGRTALLQTLEFTCRCSTCVFTTPHARCGQPRKAVFGHLCPQY